MENQSRERNCPDPGFKWYNQDENPDLSDAKLKQQTPNYTLS
jgi:hypothetical protein